MPSIGLVANVYCEANALPGWLEMGTAFFDDVRVLHSGPGGKMSTDGTIEILEKWKIPIAWGSIDDGFGVVRTTAVRFSPCEYVCLLDADERLHRYVPALKCEGEGTHRDIVNMVLQKYDNREQAGAPSNYENLHLLGKDLRVKQVGILDQGQMLRDIVANNGYDVIVAIRRHWHDFSWKRPTQNWHQIPDYQYRIVRNHPSIYWEPGRKMHEALIGAKRQYHPTPLGPYLDHYHLAMKRLEPMQRAEDIATYDKLCKTQETA